jgi:hypothetical protein
MKNIKTFESFWDFLKDKNPIKKTLHYQELYVLKKRIKAQCDKLSIQNYTINNDGTVDVNGDLNIYLVRDRVKKDERNDILINFNKVSGNVDIRLHWRKAGRAGQAQLPFTFNEVTGNFFANHSMLETLIGCPKKVGGNFDVRTNRLHTLEGAPETVGGYFCAIGNSLDNLKGSPKYVGGNFNVSDNGLKTLEGLSPRIDGTLDFNNNKITSFDYYTDCKLTRNGIEDNPIYLVLYIVLKRGRIGIKDLSSIIDLFKSYDPVHPGPSTSSDPILYLDRLELFMSEVLDREIDIKKEIESEKLSHFSSRYSGGSVRFLLEDYYSIKY